MPLGSEPSVPASGGGWGVGCDPVGGTGRRNETRVGSHHPRQAWQSCSSPAGRAPLHPASPLKSALFATQGGFLLGVVSVDRGVARARAILSGYRTPQFTRLRGVGERAVMDRAPGSNPTARFCQESGRKSNPLVPLAGAGIDFARLRAELRRTGEHCIYCPGKSIIYPFYFSDYANSPFSQVRVGSARPSLRRLRGGHRCLPLAPGSPA